MKYRAGRLSLSLQEPNPSENIASEGKKVETPAGGMVCFSADTERKLPPCRKRRNRIDYARIFVQRYRYGARFLFETHLGGNTRHVFRQQYENQAALVFYTQSVIQHTQLSCARYVITVKVCSYIPHSQQLVYIGAKHEKGGLFFLSSHRQDSRFQAGYFARLHKTAYTLKVIDERVYSPRNVQ